MENRNFSDIGRDIGKAVKDAIHSNEFSELKHTVKDAVNTAKQTVKEAAAPQKGRYTSGKAVRLTRSPPNRPILIQLP